MSTVITISPESRRASIRELVASRPLVAFIVLAYLGGWLALLPLLLAQNGFGVLPFRLPIYPFLILSTVAGPALSAIMVSWLAEGKEGVGKLLARYRTGRAA